MIEGLRFNFTRKELFIHLDLMYSRNCRTSEELREKIKKMEDKIKKLPLYSAFEDDYKYELVQLRNMLENCDQSILNFELLRDHLFNGDYSISLQEMKDIEMII